MSSRVVLRMVVVCIGVLAASMLAITVPAFAHDDDEWAVCNKPNRPIFHTSGADHVEYYGTGKCVESGLDTWRVKVGLSKEDINWGPLPNGWKYQDGSYWNYSRWAARGATRYREGDMYCSQLKQDWDYKSRFKYEYDWDDRHTTFDVFNSSDHRRVC